MPDHSELLIDAMRDAASSLRSVSASVADELRSLKRLVDAAEAAMAERLAELEQTRGFESEDAASVTVWARRELHLDASVSRQMLRASDTMRLLPAVGQAARAGRLSFAHLNRFTFALRHVGPAQTQQSESILLDLALEVEPGQLKQAIDHLRDVLYPEALDEAWIRGMDKRDLSLAALSDGWHVTGFLPIDTGAKFKAVLDSLATPVGAADLRSAAERRVDGFDELLTRVLRKGLPTDGTVRPQIHVTVDAGTLVKALAPASDSVFTPSAPATLVGFGHIGPSLLAHLTCGADLTPVLIDTVEAHTRVLDVGRSSRLATTKQRHAVWIAQSGVCASSACSNPIDHIHHDQPWSQGGPTDMSNLTGYCTQCHRHIHSHGRRAHSRARALYGPTYYAQTG